jgi:hypothetical protein
METLKLKKYVADNYAKSPLTRAQVAQGKVFINGKAYTIAGNTPHKPLTDLEVLIEDFTLTEFSKGD